MAEDSPNSTRGSDKVTTVPRCTNLITAKSLKCSHTSRNMPEDTQCCRRCQTKPAEYQTRQIFMRCQLWKPPCIFTPPGTVATPAHQDQKQISMTCQNHEPRIFTPPRTAATARTTLGSKANKHKGEDDNPSEKPTNSRQTLKLFENPLNRATQSSRRCPLNRSQHFDDRTGLHKMPNVRAPYLHPARTAAARS